MIQHEGDEAEVAEFIDGQWYVAGSSKSFCPDNYNITILSERLVYHQTHPTDNTEL